MRVDLLGVDFVGVDLMAPNPPFIQYHVGIYTHISPTAKDYNGAVAIFTRAKGQAWARARLSLSPYPILCYSWPSP